MNALYSPSTNASLANQSFQTAERHLKSEQAASHRKAGGSALAWGYGFTIAFALCMGTGTGSTVSPHSLGQRDARQVTKEFNELFIQPLPMVAPRTAAEALSYTRSVLKPAVTELASVFGVSRQAIYNWQAGEPISEENQSLLYQLAAAADTILAHPLSGKLNAKRKLAGGKTLLEAIASGISGAEAAMMLISLAEKEGAQRASIEAKLKNRKRMPVDYGAVGSPDMHEIV